MFFSRTVLNNKKEVFIQKVPKDWTDKKLEEELSKLLNLANKAEADGIPGIKYEGKTIMFEDLDVLHLEYKFLGIAYAYAHMERKKK